MKLFTHLENYAEFPQEKAHPELLQVSFSRIHSPVIIALTDGGLAQLGERLHGMQEVIGSSPLSSTNPEQYLGIQDLGIVPGFFVARNQSISQPTALPILRALANRRPLLRRLLNQWRVDWSTGL